VPLRSENMAEASRRPLLRAVATEQETESQPSAPVLEPRPTLITVARRSLLVVLAAGIAGALAGLILAQFQSERYSATGRIFLTDPNRDFGLDPDRAPYTDPLRYTRMRAELVASGPVFRRVANSLDTTPEEVQDRVKVLPSNEADFVTITGVAGSRAEAGRLVTLMQQKYEEVTTGAQQEPYRNALAQIRRDRAAVLADLRRVNEALESSPGSTTLLAERNLLQEHYRFLRDREATLAGNSGLLGSGVQLAEPPTVSVSPVSPRPMRNAAIGGMLGIILALGLLWARAGRTPTATAPEVVEPVLGAPLLAELPTPGSRDGGLGDAFDQLAATITASGSARVLYVSPVAESDRRPTIALRLAASLGRGDRVVVVDAGGTGALTESVGLGDEPGLSEVDGHGTNTLDLLRHPEVAPGTSVAVLGAGRRPRAEHATARLGPAVQELLRVVETVVIEAPSERMLATVVMPGTSGIGMVVTTPTTELSAISGARRQFALVGVPLLGFVFVRGRLGTRPLQSVSSRAAPKARSAADRLRRTNAVPKARAAADRLLRRLR
jgi:capsular polysaccharide biosynthesis protein